MLRNLPKVLLNTSRLHARRSLSQTTEPPKEKWDLCVSVLLERPPVVSKSLSPKEKEFQALLWQVEFENSLKSDHELKHEKDVLHAELIKKGEMEIDLDDSSSKQTAQDLKDAYVEEFRKFELASRETEDDLDNNLKSTNRKLEDILYLLVEQKLGDKAHFILPQGEHVEGETLRQTAERVLKSTIGDNAQTTVYGNAPVGFYKYKYPAASRKESVGAKVFFYRSMFNSGAVDEKVATKFEWHDKGGLQTKLKGGYAESVEKMLF